jgi:hypothetical protein
VVGAASDGATPSTELAPTLDLVAATGAGPATVSVTAGAFVTLAADGDVRWGALPAGAVADGSLDRQAALPLVPLTVARPSAATTRDAAPAAVLLVDRRANGAAVLELSRELGQVQWGVAVGAAAIRALPLITSAASDDAIELVATIAHGELTLSTEQQGKQIGAPPERVLGDPVAIEAALRRMREVVGATAPVRLRALRLADAEDVLTAAVGLAAAGAGELRVGDWQAAVAPPVAELVAAGFRFSIGSLSTTGTLAPDEVSTALAALAPALGACAQRHARGKAGSLLAQWLVQPSGKVGASTTAGSDDAVAACAKQVIKAATWPRPRKASSDVSARIAYTPTGQPAPSGSGATGSGGPGAGAGSVP